MPPQATLGFAYKATDNWTVMGDYQYVVWGWFSDTLPDAPIERLAVLRLDGDMYSSTWDALTALYAKVSPGGFVIVDDYHAVPGCKQAVDDFRPRHAIDAPLETIDWAGVFWRVP